MRVIQDPWPGARATRLRAAREAGAAYADATREEVAARVVENFILIRLAKVVEEDLGVDERKKRLEKVVE